MKFAVPPDYHPDGTCERTTTIDGKATVYIERSVIDAVEKLLWYYGRPQVCRASDPANSTIAFYKPTAGTNNVAMLSTRCVTTCGAVIRDSCLPQQRQWLFKSIQGYAPRIARYRHPGC